MKTNVIPLYPDIRPVVAKPYYELFWNREKIENMAIASYDLDRIKRQMLSLAKRHIEAKLYADGVEVGYVKMVKNALFPSIVICYGEHHGAA